MGDNAKLVKFTWQADRNACLFSVYECFITSNHNDRVEPAADYDTMTVPVNNIIILK